MSPKVTVSICRTCRPEGHSDDAERPGAALGRAVAAAVAARGLGAVVEVRAIACLSACSRSCAATVAGEGKFGYVMGGLSEADADALAIFAALHADSPDGIPAWRARPEAVRKNTIARLPPHGVAHPLVEPVAKAPPPEAVSSRR